MNTYQVKVLITVAHTMEVKVVDELLDRIPVGLEYTMEITDIQEVVDFPKI